MIERILPKAAMNIGVRVLPKAWKAAEFRPISACSGMKMPSSRRIIVPLSSRAGSLVMMVRNCRGNMIISRVRMAAAGNTEK